MAQLRRSGQHSFQSTAIFDRDGHRPQCRPMNMTYATIVSVCSFRGGQQKTRLPVAKPTIMPVRKPRHDLLLETWKNLFRGSKACFGRFGPDHPNDIVATNVDPSSSARLRNTHINRTSSSDAIASGARTIRSRVARKKVPRLLDFHSDRKSRILRARLGRTRSMQTYNPATLPHRMRPEPCHANRS